MLGNAIILPHSMQAHANVAAQAHIYLLKPSSQIMKADRYFLLQDHPSSCEPDGHVHISPCFVRHGSRSLYGLRSISSTFHQRPSIHPRSPREAAGGLQPYQSKCTILPCPCTSEGSFFRQQIYIYKRHFKDDSSWNGSDSEVSAPEVHADSRATCWRS